MPKRRSKPRTPATPQRRRNRVTSLATMVPLALGLAGTQLPSGQPVTRTATHHVAEAGTTLACTLPFAPIMESHPVDDSCGPDGNANADTPQALQNEQKNNFCAQGTPVSIDFAVLQQLQQEAEKRVTSGGDKSLPDDRSPLRRISTKAGNIGEGTVVKLAVFVVKAHYSNVGKGKGESVNCKEEDAEGNDIHIVLGEDSNSLRNECDSATAEMSPHFRPEMWTPQNLNENNDHKYRFTGQLFFDASHRPCAGGSGAPPKRATTWEVHPVYGVDICTAQDNSCTADQEQGWMPLEDFLKGGSNETKLRPPQIAAPAGGTKLAFNPTQLSPAKLQLPKL